MDKILLNSVKLVRRGGGSNRLTRNYHELLLQLHSPTSTSNPLTRTTNSDCIYNAELNFDYNLSIQTGVGHFNSYPTYGYNMPNNIGKILSNLSKFSNDKIDYFQAESSRYNPYFTTFGWYDFNETVYNNCIMHFPNGESYNYPGQCRDKNLYDYIVSIAQNNGILYVYIE